MPNPPIGALAQPVRNLRNSFFSETVRPCTTDLRRGENGWLSELCEGVKRAVCSTRTRSA